jgi:hypothetical protein
MTKFKDLKVGEKLSETQFYSVVKIQGDKVQIVNDAGSNTVVDKGYVESSLISASQFESTKSINKTEAASLLLNNPSVVMTVSFNKQVNPADVKKSMHDLYPNKGKMISEADYKKNVNSILKGALEGEERVIVGRHGGDLNDLGRVQFIDMEIEKDPSKNYDVRNRLVDPRNINYIILRGTKYVVK